MGLLPIGNKHLALFLVKSLILDPDPPAKIIACNSGFDDILARIESNKFNRNTHVVNKRGTAEGACLECKCFYSKWRLTAKSTF